MPRRARSVFPGVAHHITQRGNNQQAVFLSAEDRHLYLDFLRHHVTLCEVRILGYCLMPNHVHLVAVPGHAESLARALGRAHSEYALWVNRVRKRSGHLWQNRFFSCPMDATHLVRAVRYIELNPVRAGLAARAWDWPWSSALAHIEPDQWDGVLDGNWADYLGGWNYGEWQDLLAAGMTDGDCETVRTATRAGEPLGSSEFVLQLERQAGRRLRVLPRGRPRQAVAEDAAQPHLFAE